MKEWKDSKFYLGIMIVLEGTYILGFDWVDIVFNRDVL